MSRNGKVIMAMSGGVDSSVAACLLKEHGYEIIGVFLRVGAHAAQADSCAVSPDPGELASGQSIRRTQRSDATGPGEPDAGRSLSVARDLQESAPRPRLRHGCCSATDAVDARAVAGRLGVPFYALNFEKDFDRIIDYFVDEYERARTPNPCVMCNIHVKFGRLLRYADAMDAPYVATGHYARILPPQRENDELRTANNELQSESRPSRIRSSQFAIRNSSSPRLARALNRAKDQSYVLFGIRRADLPRCLFPLGEITDKSEVRRIAADLGLSVHDKPDSQEICFVPNNDYRQLVRSRRPDTVQPGDIRDTEGRLLGRHDGLAGFTIGQRRGLGIAAGRPVYVTSLDVLSNTVTIGSKERLLAGGLLADDVNWLMDPPAGAARVEIKIRHMHEPASGEIRVAADGSVRATFDEPQLAVTPGQAAVFYDPAGCVVGGGWIRAAEPAPDGGDGEAIRQGSAADERRAHR